MLDDVPSLRSAGVATTAWLERLVGLVMDFGGVEESLAATIGGAHLGAIDAMMAQWAASGGTTSVAKQTDRLLRHLAVILP